LTQQLCERALEALERTILIGAAEVREQTVRQSKYASHMLVLFVWLQIRQALCDMTHSYV